MLDDPDEGGDGNTGEETYLGPRQTTTWGEQNGFNVGLQHQVGWGRQ